MHGQCLAALLHGALTNVSVRQHNEGRGRRTSLSEAGNSGHPFIPDLFLHRTRPRKLRRWEHP